MVRVYMIIIVICAMYYCNSPPISATYVNITPKDNYFLQNRWFCIFDTPFCPFLAQFLTSFGYREHLWPIDHVLYYSAYYSTLLIYEVKISPEQDFPQNWWFCISDPLFDICWLILHHYFDKRCIFDTHFAFFALFCTISPSDSLWAYLKFNI